MKKRRGTLTDEMLEQRFSIKDLSYESNELKQFDRLISSAVSRCLKEDQSDRSGMADILSDILGEKISEHMLNAYSSEARREHSIPAYRFLALIAVTRRYDILDVIIREIGGKVVDQFGASVLEIGESYLHEIMAKNRTERAVRAVFSES